MKINGAIKKYAIGLAFAGAIALGSVTADAATIYDPALSISGIGTITVTPNTYIKSLSETKDDFGSLGDAQVEAAMESAAWFNQPITLLSSPTSGDCGTGLVTCGSSPKSGTYTGLLNSLADDANLFVVHVGGPHGGTVLAFLYSTLLNSFSISGFENGVSWIRAYKASGSLEVTPTVPLPAAFPLLLGALGGLTWLSRSRKRKLPA